MGILSSGLSGVGGMPRNIYQIILVITKGCGVQETMMEGQNTFAPLLCVVEVSRDR